RRQHVRSNRGRAASSHFLVIDREEPQRTRSSQREFVGWLCGLCERCGFSWVESPVCLAPSKADSRGQLNNTRRRGRRVDAERGAERRFGLLPGGIEHGRAI